MRDGAMMGRATLLVCGMLVLAGCAEQQAKEAASAMLVDPDSAKFRNVETVTGVIGDTVCGEINGKNRMGAYSGFARFIYNPETKTVLIRGEPSKSYEAAASDLSECRSSSYRSDCEFEEERVMEASLAMSFDSAWQNKCESPA